MKTIVLISCVKKKRDLPASAQDMYVSTLFQNQLRYARSLEPDAIYILSARHGLLALDKTIEPYDLTLNDMGFEERKRWAQRVVADLSQAADLVNDRFILLAGRKYREFLVPHLRHVEIPFEGKRIGETLAELKRRLANVDLRRTA